MTFFKLYLVSLIIFFAIDLVWLGVIAKNFYREQIGFIMSKDVQWSAAILFYCLYIAGLVFFAVMPALNEGSWSAALFSGGFFGLVCYATYDLTNLATLEGWPVKMVVYDLLWGTFISALTTLMTFWIGHHWKHHFI